MGKHRYRRRDWKSVLTVSVLLNRFHMDKAGLMKGIDIIKEYLQFIRASKALYHKDYRKLRKAVNCAGKDFSVMLEKEIFKLMLDEKLLQCDIRLCELEHGVNKSVFPYPKRYEKLYSSLNKKNREE